jgi:hypothetical protein
MVPTPDEILKVIRRDFAAKEFTMGDIFYVLYPQWNKSAFGHLFNIIKGFTKKGILHYELKQVGTPHINSKTIRRGAAFRLVT